MSDDVLSIIPTDPWWQPERAAGERAGALAMDLASGLPDGVAAETEVTWYDTPTPVDCGGEPGADRLSPLRWLDRHRVVGGSARSP
ncbi:hypothetical protein [Streptomyces murinus]|uniref:hypothetical protein n=1 Tax=Streptomyces murinus TaxID=33900 RepID=UPI0037F151F2